MYGAQLKSNARGMPGGGRVGGIGGFGIDCYITMIEKAGLSKTL